MLRAEVSLSSITDEEATPERKAPIRLKFEIPYFTVSGIQVCSCETLVFINLDFLQFLGISNALCTNLNFMLGWNQMRGNLMKLKLRGQGLQEKYERGEIEIHGSAVLR